jgi:hypothetical protein
MGGAIPLLPLYAFVPWLGKIVPLLGAFAESHKVTVTSSFIMSCLFVRPSVTIWKNSGPARRISMKIDI